MMKKFSVLMLTILIVIFTTLLLYRIFDLGVTITYLEDDLERALNQSKLLIQLQRAPCTEINNIPNDSSVFEKDGSIVIDNVVFECTRKDNANEDTLYYKNSTSR